MNSSYFENRACEYYPCHKRENINCIFCFCPLYNFEDCGGTPEYIEGKDGKMIKDCSKCVYPHIQENYDEIIKRLSR